MFLQFGRRRLLRGGVGVGGQFDVDRHLIEVAAAGYLKLVVGRQTGDFEDLLLHLGGKHVHAADDQHVVATAGDFVHAAHGAGRARQQPGQVAGAVAHYRQSFLGEAGEHQFALLAVRQHLPCLRVNDFRVEVVFPDGGAVLGLHTFLSDAGTHNLGQAVNIHRVDVQPLFQIGAHGSRPGFSAEDSHPQSQFTAIDTLAFQFVGDTEHIRGRDHDDIGVKVLDELRLFFRLPAGHGDNGAPHQLAAVVGAQTAGEQAVAVGHVNFVFVIAPCSPDGARHDPAPGVDILTGITYHHRFAGGATGSMDAHHVIRGHGEHAERVVIPHVMLVGEWEFAQVGKLLQVGRMGASRIEFLPVARHIGVGVFQAPLQPLQLQAAQLVDTGFFNGF